MLSFHVATLLCWFQEIAKKLKLFSIQANGLAC
jgi:hypothetical protein